MHDLLAILPVTVGIAILYALSLYSRRITDALERGDIHPDSTSW